MRTGAHASSPAGKARGKSHEAHVVTPHLEIQYVNHNFAGFEKLGKRLAVDGEPFVLLIVRDEVFHARRDTFGLHSVDVSTGN